MCKERGMRNKRCMQSLLFLVWYECKERGMRNKRCMQSLIVCYLVLRGKMRSEYYNLTSTPT